mgnify:FL=1
MLDIEKRASIFGSSQSVDKVSDFVDTFLCMLSAGTASACSLRLVLFPQESAQITANFQTKIICLN